MRLELKKRILSRVSFNKERFRIELENALRKLDRDERESLKTWVKMEFGAKHPNIIETVFNKEAKRIRLGL